MTNTKIATGAAITAAIIIPVISNISLVSLFITIIYHRIRCLSRGFFTFFCALPPYSPNGLMAIHMAK